MRSAASLKASDKGLNLGEISKAAGWSNTETLAVFYKKTISENLGRVILRKYYNLLDCFYCQVLLCFQKGFENGDQSHINTFQGRRTFQRENNFNKTSPRYVNLQIFFATMSLPLTQLICHQAIVMGILKISRKIYSLFSVSISGVLIKPLNFCITP